MERPLQGREQLPPLERQGGSKAAGHPPAYSLRVQGEGWGGDGGNVGHHPIPLLTSPLKGEESDR
jgi:hypothetical protein